MNVGQSFPPASLGVPCKLRSRGRRENKLVPDGARVKRDADLFACRGIANSTTIPVLHSPCKNINCYLLVIYIKMQTKYYNTIKTILCFER